ncbi:hypothetical protein [Sporomusa sp. KB1]|uniref:hypothetical protein n=1 Tax=Sporomusa sp. KB1 TaxID=943346 RepID=UPI001C95898A|nr:hypothetical protein [Sporomusa sp. KB1]
MNGNKAEQDGHQNHPSLRFLSLNLHTIKQTNNHLFPANYYYFLYQGKEKTWTGLSFPIHFE